MGQDWPQMGQIRGFFRSDFSAFGAPAPSLATTARVRISLFTNCLLVATKMAKRDLHVAIIFKIRFKISAHSGVRETKRTGQLNPISNLKRFVPNY